MFDLNKMRLAGAFLAMLIGVTSISSAAEAQNNTLRRIYDNELKIFADNETYWKAHSLDRMYFSPDGTFIQQLNDGWNDIPVGTMFTGTWEVANDQICWTYDQKTADVYQTSPDPYCYEVLTNSPADNFLTTHMETFRLFPANAPESQAARTVAFEWNRYAYDNYILAPDYVDDVKTGLETMASYRRNGRIPDGTILREELADDWMKAYYDETVNRIFFIAEQLMFFNDKGLYFYTDEQKIRDANGDIDKMIATGTKGRWQMKDNIHCWFLSEGRSSCEFVVPEGQGLIRPYDGFFGIFYNGFTRVHGEMATGHISPDETSAPELFNRLMDVAP